MTRFRFWALLVPGLLLPCALPAAGDPEAGRAKAGPCAACHGPDGNSVNPQWPSLAGQGAPYLATQLRRFKSGARENALMAPPAAALGEQDILDLAAYYAAQTPALGVARAAAPLLRLGETIYRGGVLERKVPACIGCHGPSGAGNEPAEFPRLSGQHAAYTALQLRSFREGFKPHREHERQNSMMNAIAASLTDRDIEAVSHYISGLY